MNLAQNILALSTFVGFLSVGTAGQAADLSSGLTMKPLQGVSFDIGTKRAVSYFLRNDGQCKLVLTLAEAPDWSDVSKFSATRFEAAVNPGKATRYNSTEGVAIDFACQADAQAMSIRAAQQVAAAPTR
jgi:hypothetical protein